MSICNVYIYIYYLLVLWLCRFCIFVELLGVIISNYYSFYFIKLLFFLFYFENRKGCYGVKG